MCSNFSQEQQRPPSGRESLTLGLHLVWFHSAATWGYVLFHCDSGVGIGVLFLAGFTGIRSYYSHSKIWQMEMTSSLIMWMRLPEHYREGFPWKACIATKLCTISIVLGLQRSLKRTPTETGEDVHAHLLYLVIVITQGHQNVSLKGEHPKRDEII